MPVRPPSENRLLFFTPTLAAAGAQPARSSYLNNLKSFGPVLTMQAKHGPLARELTPDIPVFETAALEEIRERSRASGSMDA